MMTFPGFRTPRVSASSTMDRAIRSLMLPPGLARSCLHHTSMPSSKEPVDPMCGVSPMMWRIESKGISIGEGGYVTLERERAAPGHDLLPSAGR